MRHTLCLRGGITRPVERGRVVIPGKPQSARGIGVGRVAAHVLGNVFLGLAVGLVLYWGITYIQARLSQDALREQLGVDRSEPASVESSAVPMDWENLESEDVAFWEALPSGAAFGRIVSAKIGMDAVVVKGHARSDLAKGPGWLGYTDLPGPTGNVGIAGHRTTFGAPFAALHRLSPGDTIDLYSPYRRFRYEVLGSEQVTPDRVDVMDTTEAPQLTLSACDPPYSARYRLIVRARLVEVARLVSDE